MIKISIKHINILSIIAREDKFPNEPIILSKELK